MTPRKRVFNEEWMEFNFKNYHQMYLGRDAPTPKMGYPDMGSGYYSK